MKPRVIWKSMGRSLRRRLATLILAGLAPSGLKATAEARVAKPAESRSVKPAAPVKSRPAENKVKELAFKREIILRQGINRKAQSKVAQVLVDGKKLKEIQCYEKDTAKPFAAVTVKSDKLLLHCEEGYLGGIYGSYGRSERVQLAQIEADGGSSLVVTSKIVKTKKGAPPVIYIASILQNVPESDGPPQVDCQEAVKEYYWDAKSKSIEKRNSKKNLTEFISGFTGFAEKCKTRWENL
ncbi:MAG TPA: hypothetical protein VFV50_09570 [Bdellovibrionales bacterium]|nr:hypothetical protein [Bdellovibrionales bacterium]